MLPPVSEQKVISHPRPDEKALSISLNTLPWETKTTDQTEYIKHIKRVSDDRDIKFRVVYLARAE